MGYTPYNFYNFARHLHTELNRKMLQTSEITKMFIELFPRIFTRFIYSSDNYEYDNKTEENVSEFHLYKTRNYYRVLYKWLVYTY